MSSNLVTIPEAVKNYINTGTFTPTFFAERKHLPTMELKEFTDLKVHILTGSKIIEIDSRGSSHSTITVPIYINKRLNKDQYQSEIDSLIQLADDINTFLLSKTIPNTKFTCIGANFVTIPESSRLASQNVFTSLVNLTYHDGNR